MSNMDKKQYNDYDIDKEKQKFKNIDEWWKNEFCERMKRWRGE